MHMCVYTCSAVKAHTGRPAASSNVQFFGFNAISWIEKITKKTFREIHKHAYNHYFLHLKSLNTNTRKYNAVPSPQEQYIPHNIQIWKEWIHQTHNRLQVIIQNASDVRKRVQKMVRSEKDLPILKFFTAKPIETTTPLISPPELMICKLSINWATELSSTWYMRQPNYHGWKSSLSYFAIHWIHPRAYNLRWLTMNGEKISVEWK